MEVKADGVWGWRPHHLHVPNVMKIWETKPPGTLWATPGLLREDYTFQNSAQKEWLRNSQYWRTNNSPSRRQWTADAVISAAYTNTLCACIK